MVSLLHQKQDHNLVTQFLRSIHYQSSSGDKPYGNTLNILSAIFKAAGQKHLLYLVKLRKLWFDKVDNFLARNSYPRNISVLSQFTVNDSVLQEFSKKHIHADFLNALEKLKGVSFKQFKQFNARLQKILKRPLSPEETELLKNKVRFKPQKTILHLTVYDGGIAQALRFETEAYLRMFNRLLPELKLDDIQCHVGDLGQTQYDQRQVASLAKDWHLITPPEVHQLSMPAFLHRVSRGHAVLVIYVKTQEEMALLKRTPGADWLVKHLHNQLPELQEVVQKIAFVPKHELDLEQIRLRTVVLGNTAGDESSVSNVKSGLTADQPLKNSLHAKEQFAKIRKILNRNTAPPSVSSQSDS